MSFFHALATARGMPLFCCLALCLMPSLSYSFPFSPEPERAWHNGNSAEPQETTPIAKEQEEILPVQGAVTSNNGQTLKGQLMHPEKLPLSQQAKSKDKGLVRQGMLQEAAGTIAFQQAFQFRYKQLLAACEARAYAFDRLFNFRPLLMHERVLPPVIRWVGRSTTVHDEQTATSVEASYHIVQPARLISKVPEWRDYLTMDIAAFALDKAMLPKGKEELKLWQAAIEKGWEEGLQEADDVYALNMARLVADFRGMLRFKMLVERKMVSLPVLAEGTPMIKVGERTLDVNETIFRITVPATFTKAEEWQDNELAQRMQDID